MRLVVFVQGGSQWQKLLGCLVVAFPVAVLTAPFAVGLPVFVMEHLSISGSPPPPLGFLVGDVALGGIVAVAAFVTGSFYATCLSTLPSRILKVASSTSQKLAHQVLSLAQPTILLLLHLKIHLPQASVGFSPLGSRPGSRPSAKDQRSCLAAISPRNGPKMQCLSISPASDHALVQKTILTLS